MTKGFVYTSDAVNRFINRHKNRQHLLPADTDVAGFTNLIERKCAGILVDRTVAAALIFENNRLKDVKRYFPITFDPRNIHYILRKKSVNPKTVQQVNKAIKRLKQSNAYSIIIESPLCQDRCRLKSAVKPHWHIDYFRKKAIITNI